MEHRNRAIGLCSGGLALSLALGLAAPAGAVELYSDDDTHLNADVLAVFGMMNSRKNYDGTTGGSTWREGFIKYGLSGDQGLACLLYTSPSPRDLSTSRMPSSA